MKIVVIVAVWKRPEIFRIFAESITSLKGDIAVCVAGSPEDGCKAISLGYGFDYVQVPNRPLNKKLNAASYLASKTDADYFLIMGSDDIINQELFNKYLELAKKYEHIYLTDAYFYDTIYKKLKFWRGYKGRKGMERALGCGRLLSRRLMRDVLFQPWPNDKDINKGLDRYLMDNMDLKESESIGITTWGTNMAVMDIKSSVNITKMKEIIGRDLDMKSLKLFPKNIMELIEST